MAATATATGGLGRLAVWVVPVERTKSQHHEPFDILFRVFWKWPSVPLHGGNHVHIFRIPADEVLRAPQEPTWPLEPLHPRHLSEKLPA